MAIKNFWAQWPKSYRFLLRIVLGLLFLCLVFLGIRAAFQEDVPDRERATFVVQRGRLDISIVESGTIKAREQAILKSEVEGRTTILSLVEEGTRVKKGDLLIELDASELQDQLIDQQIRVQNAEAAFIRARENLEVTKNQAQSDVEKAELTYQFAVEDLKNYQEGEFPKDLKEAESKISVAQEELRRAQEKLEWSRILFEEKYISQTELQADELAAKKAQLDLDLSIEGLNLLENFEYKRNLAELQSEAKQTEMALERARRKASADVVQAEADLRAKDSEFNRENSKLEKIKRQIENTKIYAPTDGLVVYASSAKATWRSNSEPLSEGQEVRERQELIYLPAADLVMAEVKIHESALDKVKVGLEAKVTVDALPGRIFQGTVNSIAPLPDAISVWLNPDLKVYNAEIYLDGESRALRNGMSCRAEILAQRYDDVVFVPVQAVTKLNDQPVAYVLKGEKIEVRMVEVGMDNNRMVHIKAGLEPGEEVLLAPPLMPATGSGKRLEGDPRNQTRPEMPGEKGSMRP